MKYQIDFKLVNHCQDCLAFKQAAQCNMCKEMRPVWATLVKQEWAKPLPPEPPPFNTIMIRIYKILQQNGEYNAGKLLYQMIGPELLAEKLAYEKSMSDWCEKNQ